METVAPHRDTDAWIFQSWVSFVLSFGTTLVGIVWLPVDNWTRGFLAMGLLFTVQRLLHPGQDHSRQPRGLQVHQPPDGREGGEAAPGVRGKVGPGLRHHAARSRRSHADDRRRAPRRVARDSGRAVDGALPRLGAIGDEPRGEPITAGKWSRKQVIGHLVDSALNNEQRFVRAQLGGLALLPAYAQEEWVEVQAHQERSWARPPDPVDGRSTGTWSTCSTTSIRARWGRRARSAAARPSPSATSPRTTSVHLRHHLAQVLTPDVVA